MASPPKTATMARRATARSVADRRRILRRFGRSGGRRAGPFQPRQRHQRLDPRPRVAVRDLWPETHFRPPLPLRQPSVCRQSGSYWSLCPPGVTSPRCMTPCRGATRPMTFRPIKPASAPATCWIGSWRVCAARGWGYFTTRCDDDARAAVDRVAHALGADSELQFADAALARSAALSSAPAKAAINICRIFASRPSALNPTPASGCWPGR